MKKLICFMFGILAMIGISADNEKIHTSSMKCEIKGKLPQNSHATKVFLQKIEQNHFVTTDSTLAGDGNFILTTTAGATPVVRYLRFNDTESEPVKIFIDADELIVKQTKDGICITGSGTNDTYSKIWQEIAPLREAKQNAYQRYKDKSLSNEEHKQAEEDYDKADEKETEIYLTYLKDNADNILGYDILTNLYYTMEGALVEQYLKKLPAVFKEEAQYKRIERYVENDKKCLPGTDYHDITLKTPEGETKKLSDYIKEGKYTILDFWASWCGPCRAEMPNMVKIYKEFNTYGIEIIGISLDKDEAAWKKAIKDMDMTWPQLSDLKFWQSEAVKTYGVQAIPMTVTIGPNGRILRKNLRGEKLYDEVATWAEKLK